MARNIRLSIRPNGDTEISTAYFNVTLFVDHDTIEGKFPALSEPLKAALNQWLLSYYGQDKVRSYCDCLALQEQPNEIEPDESTLYRPIPGQVIRRDVGEIRTLSDLLKKSFNEWLSPTPDWIDIRDCLIREMGAAGNANSANNGQFQFMLDIRDSDIILKRLPWQEWNILQNHHLNTEFTLRAGINHLWKRYDYPKSIRIRILAVIGASEINSNGTTSRIDLSRDLQTLYDLERTNPLIEVCALEQPTGKEFQEKLEDEQGYHIFLFAGHSRSRADGQIGWLILNSTEEPLAISDFKENIGEAIRRGLKLAIFNSCDGLGLARQIAALHLPQCIVMREPIPNEVAVEFISRFFNQFVNQQKSLVESVQLARRGLESFNRQFPGVMWLPTVFTRLGNEALTWQTLLDHLQPLAETDILPVKPVQLPRPKVPVWAIGGVSALVLAGLGIFWAAPALCRIGNFPGCSSVSDLTPALPEAEQLVGRGEKLLYGSRKLSGDYQQWKEAGIAAFQSGNYAAARDQFDQIRITAKNQKEDADAADALRDPEVLIYRNNSEVRRRNQTNNEPIYTIAVAAPLSNADGEPLWEGQQILFGIAQAQDQAVQKGLNLEIVLANDLNSPDQAVKVAEYLTQMNNQINNQINNNSQRILAVIGHYTSESSCRALPIYHRAGLVLISSTSTVTNLRAVCNGGDDFFRTTSSSQIEAKTLIGYLLKLKSNPRIALFYNSADLFSRDTRIKFKEALANQGTIVAEYNLDPKTVPDFNTEKIMAEIQDVDALAMIPDGRSGGSGGFDRAVEMIKVSNGEKVILGANPLYQSTVVARGGGLERLAGKLFTAVDWYPECGNPAFVKQAEQEYWFGGINRLTALSYEAVQVLEAVLSPGITSQVIQQKLSSGVNLESAVFKNRQISFDEDGDRREITQRVVTTPGGAENNIVFNLPSGESCPP